MIELSKIDKNYHLVEVIRDLNLTIKDGEFIVVVGPSGCGKTTLLRMIAGLETISGGDLVIGNQRANDLPPQKRNIAMVFQTYALFPHMTVKQNIAFGPEVRGEKKAAIEAKIQRAADVLNISSYLARKPSELSGGQRQRVAMGRAIVRDSDVFLFDEPLSNLDAHLRVEMRTEIKALHQKLRATIVYVTHDQIEAMTMADRIVIMNGGCIEQVGPPTELYDRPRNTFVAGFLGSPAMNFLSCTATGEGNVNHVHLEDDAVVQIMEKSVESADLLLGIRPEAFQIDPDGPFSFSVQVIEPTGSEVLVYGEMLGKGVRCVFTGRPKIDVGDDLHLSVEPESIHVFDRATGLRL